MNSLILLIICVGLPMNIFGLYATWTPKTPFILKALFKFGSLIYIIAIAVYIVKYYNIF